MFFWIIAPSCADLDEYIEGNWQPFETLGLAGYSRDHIVLGDRAVMRGLANSAALSRRSQQYFKSVFSRYSELAVLRRRMTPIFVGGEGVGQSAEPISVDISFFSRPNSCGQAVLLSEHIYDYKVISALVESWVAMMGFAAVCGVSFRFAAGGGGGTGHVLRVYELDGASIGCCIVDSDKAHLDDQVGPTANFCQDVHVDGWRWSLHVIEGRELENLIPNCILDVAVRETIRPIPELYSDENWVIGGYSDHKITDSLCRFLKSPPVAARATDSIGALSRRESGRMMGCCRNAACGDEDPACVVTTGHGGVLQAVSAHIEKRGVPREFDTVGPLVNLLNVVLSAGVSLRMRFA